MDGPELTHPNSRSQQTSNRQTAETLTRIDLAQRTLNADLRLITCWNLNSTHCLMLQPSDTQMFTTHSLFTHTCTQPSERESKATLTRNGAKQSTVSPMTTDTHTQTYTNTQHTTRMHTHRQ